MKAQVNDRVRLLKQPLFLEPATNGAERPNPDAYALVDTVYSDGSIKVTNMNMPFLGTYCGLWVDKSKYKVVR